MQSFALNSSTERTQAHPRGVRVGSSSRKSIFSVQLVVLVHEADLAARRRVIAASDTTLCGTQLVLQRQRLRRGSYVIVSDVHCTLTHLVRNLQAKACKVVG